MDESFSLGDLMRLGLHQYVEACSEIVDRAEKGAHHRERAAQDRGRLGRPRPLLHALPGVACRCCGGLSVHVIKIFSDQCWFLCKTEECQR